MAPLAYTQYVICFLSKQMRTEQAQMRHLATQALVPFMQIKEDLEYIQTQHWSPYIGKHLTCCANKAHLALQKGFTATEVM